MGSMSLRNKAVPTPAAKNRTGISTQAFLDARLIVSNPQTNWVRRQCTAGCVSQAN